MTSTPKLSLPYLSPQQAQKHVTLNEALRRLDAVAQLTVVSRAVTVQPASPAEGDAYILPSGATGAAWATMSAVDIVVFQDGGWTAISPQPGWRAWVEDEAELYVHLSGGWVRAAAGAGAAEEVDLLGLNTQADVVNRLSVKSDAILLSHDDVTPGTGDMRIVCNKSGAAGVSALVFQTGFSARVELGLVGDDDFRIKVSPDNFASSHHAVRIDKDNGRVAIGGGEPGDKLHIQGGNILVDNNFGLYAKDTSNGPRRIFHFGGDNNVYFNANGLANAIRFQTSGANKVEIAPSGGVVVGAASGGDKGTGSINAEAVYDDNALLSCYVFDAVLDGQINPEKWDAKVANRQVAEIVDDTGEIEPKDEIERAHEPMRKFAARIGDKYDPLTLDGYAAHWRDKRHLSAMPNEEKYHPLDNTLTTGEWIQRLVETVEVQAVLIETLNMRIKQIDKAISDRSGFDD